jgi:ech hydrogenase subunit A
LPELDSQFGGNYNYVGFKDILLRQFTLMRGASKLDSYVLLIILILLPVLSAVLCHTFKNSTMRKIVVVFSTVVMSVTAVNFGFALKRAGGRIAIGLENVPFDLGFIISFLDILLLLYIVYTGLRLKKLSIVALSLLQLIPMVLFEVFGSVSEPETAFLIDYLSLIMILLVSVIGSVILVFSSGYMKKHEDHLGLKVSKQPRFFTILFIFLGTMNALAATNNLLWMYFFWEVTTLCSCLLISHDRTEVAVKNATRALWINLLGGVAFIAAIILIYKSKGTLSIETIASAQPGAAFNGLFPVALGLLCFAGLTKAAQFPFQSWLLGAMVAPTPVSALLHSSTMVKAGVYLFVRMAPAFSGTILGKLVAVAGGFTFLAGSAIAIGQRNSKRVLAYSTIANLGLVICCAGLGTYAALGAAIMLIIYHAISKSLLFLCVGTIEQGIGSRDIEDMQGLMKKMPFTTVITVIGMLSMMLPPFGVLITKWLAIEASVSQPLVLIFIILGSAFTIVFWAKWIGIILTMSYKTKYYTEKLPITVRSSLITLITGVLTSSILIAPLFNTLVKPQLAGLNLSEASQIVGKNGGIWLYNINNALMGGFESVLFFLVVLAIR